MNTAEEIELLRNALDHIRRTALASSGQTRRVRWIAQRAQVALEGQHYRNSDFDLVKNVPRDLDRDKFAKLYRRLRGRDRLPDECAFTVHDLADLYGDDMDAVIEALPPLVPPATEPRTCGRPYSVMPGNETPDEPRSGIYFADADDKLHGPYVTYHEANSKIKELQESAQ